MLEQTPQFQSGEAGAEAEVTAAAERGVGTGDATSRLHDGQRVLVDGDAGEVRVIA